MSIIEDKIAKMILIKEKDEIIKHINDILSRNLTSSERNKQILKFLDIKLLSDSTNKRKVQMILEKLQIKQTSKNKILKQQEFYIDLIGNDFIKSFNETNKNINQRQLMKCLRFYYYDYVFKNISKKSILIYLNEWADLKYIDDISSNAKLRSENEFNALFKELNIKSDETLVKSKFNIEVFDYIFKFYALNKLEYTSIHGNKIQTFLMNQPSMKEKMRQNGIKNWKNPKYRESVISTLNETNKLPDTKLHRSNAAKTLQQKPGHKEKQSKSLTLFWSNTTDVFKDYHRYLSKKGTINAYEAHPEYNEKRNLNLKLSYKTHPERRIEKSKFFKNLWSNEAHSERIYNTKKENGTFNTSKSEEDCYNKLKDIFIEKDVIRQYKSKEYPFFCDFYVNSLDLYIECDFSWTHGGHLFDKNNNNDIETLCKIYEKALISKYYENMLQNWVITDPLKYWYQTKNNLNFLRFYTEDEFNNWYETERDRINEEHEIILH